MASQTALRMEQEYDFADLIHPVAWATFLAEYHEKQPLVVKRAQPDYYADILTIDRINDHLGSADLIYPGVRLVKDANEVNPAKYTYTVTTTPKKATEGVVDKEKLFTYFLSGYTVILNSHERHSREMLHLRHVTEKAFSAKAQANIYLTPRGSQGFTPHWDTHDVLILQVGGKKDWRVYNSPIKLPTKNQLFSGEWERTPPLLATTLESGDLLYIPRGYVHDATATDNHISLHITLGIKAYTYADLLRILLGRIDEDLFFRASIAPGFGIDLDRFAKYVAGYVTPQRASAALEEIRQFFGSNRLADSSDRLRDYLAVGDLKATTKLRKRRSIYFERDLNNTQVVLRFNNKAVKFPDHITDSIDFILAAEQFRPRDLPGRIDEPSKVLICRKLVDEGFLTFCDYSNR
jgi:hypothetical protein